MRNRDRLYIAERLKTEFKDNIIELLKSKDMNYLDKMWIATEVVPEDILKKFIAECLIVTAKHGDRKGYVAEAAQNPDTEYAAYSVAGYTLASVADYYPNVPTGEPFRNAEMMRQIESLITLLETAGAE